MRLLAGSAAILVLVFATACGGGGGNFPTASSGTDNTGIPTPVPGATATPAGAAAAASCALQAAGTGDVISMEGTHSLNPSDETIKTGDSVTWTNNSSTNHHIKFDAGPDCGFTLIGKSVSIQFSNPGTFTYFCTIHPTFMHGTITVQ